MHSRSVTKSALLLLLSLVILVTLVSPAFAVQLLGNWIYRQDGGDGLDTQSEFQQRYQLGVGPAVAYKLTPAITASGGVGYRQTRRDRGDGFETVEQVSPFGQLTLVNDIFLAALSANSFTTMAGSDNSSAFWNASIASLWDIPLWPALEISYGENYSGVDGKTLFDDSNGKNQNTTVVVDWDLLLADLYYEYSFNEQIDGDGESLSEATSHYARFKTDGRFWQDRINVFLNQQYRETTSEFGGSGAELDPDGLFRIPVEGDAAYLRTLTALAPDPEFEPVNLTNKPELTDGILNFIDTDSVPPVRPFDTGNFGFTPFDSQQINRLFLYLRSSVNPDGVTGLTWQIYTKMPTDLFWSLEIADVPFSYNNSLARFELIFPTIDGPEFLLVVTNPSDGVELVFTELEAFRATEIDDSFGSPTFKNTFYKTNISGGFRPFRLLSTSFAFNYEHNDDKLNGDKVREEDRISWSGGMTLTQLPYVTPSLSYSETRYERTGQLDNSNRSYSVNIATRPLPSLNFSVAYTHGDRYVDDEKTNTTDTYSLFAKASIYPDLSVSWNNSYANSDDLKRGTGSGDEVFVNTKTLSSRLDISARLHRHLTAYVSGDYGKRDSEETGIDENARATFTVNYRPSSRLSVSSTYGTFFLDDDRSDALSASMELFILNTNKSRLSVISSHTHSDETFHDFRVIGNWDISDYFSFTGNGNYSMAPSRDTYSFYLSLAFRLL